MLFKIMTGSFQEFRTLYPELHHSRYIGGYAEQAQTMAYGTVIVLSGNYRENEIFRSPYWPILEKKCVVIKGERL